MMCRLKKYGILKDIFRFWEYHTLLMKSKRGKALCKSKMQLQGFSNLFFFVLLVMLLFFSSCSLRACMKWQYEKWIILSLNLTRHQSHNITQTFSHAKLTGNFNNFQKYWKETRKLNLNLHIIHVQEIFVDLYSKNKTDFEECSFIVFFEVSFIYKQQGKLFWPFWN